MTRILLLALLLCFVLPRSAAAEDAAAIGTVAEIEGPVTRYAFDELPADAKIGAIPEVGQAVYLHDIIETGPGGKAHILFIDDTELTLGENARLTVDEYVFDAEAKTPGKGRFSVLNGAFLFVSGLISKHEKPDVEIATTYGTIGIRGTVVWGGTLEDQYNIFVQEGQVTFATERGRVTVGPGEGTMAHSRRAIPTRAKAWGQEKITRAVSTISLRNAEQVKQRVAGLKERHAEMRAKHRETVKEKREIRREQQQERRDDRTNRMQEKGRQHGEKRTDLPKSQDMQGPVQQQKPQQEQPSTGNPARDFERREQNHLGKDAPAP